MNNKLPNNEDLRSLDAICLNESELEHKWYHNIKYLVVGIVFGIVFVKAEVISWFRIQEMFRMQSFHMYGIIGSAIAVGMLSIWLIKKFNIKTIYGINGKTKLPIFQNQNSKKNTQTHKPFN